MSLLSGFNVTLPEVGLLGEAAMAAFTGGAVPAGWNVITPQQLGVPAQFWDGNYFNNNGASAIVLQQGSTWIVSFRGTDGPDDIVRYPELVLGTYINHFAPLLNGVASNAPDGTSFYFTGASLGGGATNLMANIAGSQYGGEFASAKFVAFASPLISTASGIFNIGFENDPVYKALSSYNDFSSSIDNLVLATSQYMQGNYDGLHPPDDYAHNAASSFDAFARLQSSAFFNQMNPDSVVIFDVFDGTVQDITPGRENTGVFYLGENVADIIVGRNSNDYLEGFAGDDNLNGGAGLDTAGVHDTLDNTIVQLTGSGIGTLTSNDGIDALFDVERVLFNDAALALDIDGNAGQAYRLYQASFDRVPDQGGLGYWISALDNGFGLAGVALSFIHSAEFQATYGALDTLSNQQFITLLYANVLDRAPDQGGLDYWLTAMNNGFPHYATLVSFSESAENKQNVIGAIDNGIEYIPWLA
jgi:Domain of unknown function (DUF4214)/RTX calcium-binding nonapeptide repeat (4 copies)